MTQPVPTGQYWTELGELKLTWSASAHSMATGQKSG